MAPQKKTIVWSIRLSPEEVALLDRAAERKDAKPREITRGVLVRWARRVLAG